MYVACGLAVILLAPYAGCHLLVTRAPDPVTQETTQEAPSASSDETELPPPPSSRLRGRSRDSLADIEQLLGNKN
jgi:hypothetical protein